MMKDGAVS